MRTASRLGIFGIGVVVVFGLAAAAGASLGPISVGSSGSHRASDHTNGAATREPDAVTVADGYQVAMSGVPMVGSSTIAFDVSRDGQSLTTDPHRGATGHLVAIRADDIGYLHVDPTAGSDGTDRFVVEFPTPGTYRLFFDFSRDGAVHTASFTIEVPTS